MRRIVAALAALTLAACAPGVAPLPPAAPVPMPEPVVAAPSRPTRLRVAARHDTARYDVTSTTRLTRDSAGTPIEEEVTLRGQVALALERSADRVLRSTGRVDGFTISSTSRVAGARASALPGVAVVPPTPSLPLTVAFDATLDGLSARVVPRPTLANECDRPEMSAVALARELLVRMPEELVVGATWSDTARVFMCRGGIPVTIQTVASNTVRSLDDGPNGLATRAAITRTLSTRVEGQLATGWRTVSLTGSGSGEQQVLVDGVSGVVQTLRGESTLALTVRDSVRPDDGEQTVTQRVTLTAQLRPTRTP